MLDGLLETKQNRVTWSKVAACSTAPGDLPQYVPQGRLSAMSLEALQYAESLDLFDQKILANRLYRFGSFPVSPRRHRRWTTSFLSSDTPNEYGSGLRVSPVGSLGLVGRVSYSGRWINWFPEEKNQQPDPNRPVYKLYVSPLPDNVEECLSTIARFLIHDGLFALKVANSIGNVVRPDKIIAYFTSIESLRTVGERVSESLRGIPVHGVPFTATFSDDGLTSWAIDPPRSMIDQNHPNEVFSWRAWITRHLAKSLLMARSKVDASIPPWRFALERLRSDGVEPESWTPTRMPWLSPEDL